MPQTFMLRSSAVDDKQDNAKRSPASDRPVLRAPLGIAKYVLATSRSLGAISFTYHVAPAVSSPQIGIPRLLFSNAWSDKASAISISLRRHIEKVHDRIIAKGTPTTYLSLMQDDRAFSSDVATKISQKVDRAGIIDEIIIPVYGPFKIEGCMCFGFDRPVKSLDPDTIFKLESLAAVGHTKIISTFRDQINKISLSRREREVLQWIALGKSQPDIATILGVKNTTVDSYTRRIYAKLGVNSKIAAVLAGISTGIISL